MKVIVILIVIDVLYTVTIGLVQEVEDLEIGAQVEDWLEY